MSLIGQGKTEILSGNGFVPALYAKGDSQGMACCPDFKSRAFSSGAHALSPRCKHWLESSRYCTIMTTDIDSHVQPCDEHTVCGRFARYTGSFHLVASWCS